MTKTEKTYRILSLIGFVLHICSSVIVMVASFLPFREKQNFYEVFTGFFSSKLSELQPYVVLLVLIVTCVCSFFAIKRPHFWFYVLISTFAFYLIIALPYSIESAFVGFTSKWIGSSISNYGMGYKLIMGVSNIFYLDIAFFIYSVVTLVVGIKKVHK